jgi:hypothetical protein
VRLPVAILSGVASSVIAALPLAWINGGLHPLIAWTALLLGVMVTALVFRQCREMESRVLSIWDWGMIAVFACSSARAFLWLIYADGDSWKILSPNNLGDLSLHLAFIHWLASTTHWWPGSPILVGDPLRYPLGSDLFNALLLVAGISPSIGLVWCGLVGSALTGYALWRWGGAMALAAFLFNGGLAGVVLLKGGDPDALSEWKNLFLTLFVTQRGFLYAMPAGLLLLFAWKKENFGEQREVVPLAVQALLLGAIPLFSIHAALFIGISMVGQFVFAPGCRSRMTRLAFISWPPMALFGWLVTSGCGGHSAIHALGWAPGWMSDGTVWFWIWNFGITLPLLLLLLLKVTRDAADSEARAFVLPAILVFLLCMIIRFAPWPWDNMKLMIWSWVVIAPFLWNCLIKGWNGIVKGAILVLLFGSGAATLVAGLDGRHGYELIRRSLLDQAKWELREAPPDAVIACAPEYNHPVLMLGHPVVCGYEGHLWSHGLDYKGRLELLNSVMMGEPGWLQKAQSLGVSYIYWGDAEAKRWPDSQLPWAREINGTLHRVQ